MIEQDEKVVYILATETTVEDNHNEFEIIVEKIIDRDFDTDFEVLKYIDSQYIDYEKDVSLLEAYLLSYKDFGKVKLYTNQSFDLSRNIWIEVNEEYFFITSKEDILLNFLEKFEFIEKFDIVRGLDKGYCSIGIPETEYYIEDIIAKESKYNQLGIHPKYYYKKIYNNINYDYDELYIYEDIEEKEMRFHIRLYGTDENLLIIKDANDNIIMEVEDFRFKARVYFEDINFDGHIDVRYYSEGTMNESFDLYIWNDYKKVFEKVIYTGFKYITSNAKFYADYVKNSIKSIDEVTIQTLKWKDNELIFIDEYTFEIGED